MTSNTDVSKVDASDANNCAIVETSNKSKLEELYKQMNTGDILLFGSRKYWISRLIEWYGHSKWSHVGIVLKDPVYINPLLKGLYLLESGAEDMPDVVDHVHKYGVQIVPLEEKIEEYNGYVHWRKLDADIDDLDYKMLSIYISVHDRPYDLSFYDLLTTKMNVDLKVHKYKNPIMNWLRTDHRRIDQFFCSALVGYIYTELELINKNTQWTECRPSYFSQEYPKNIMIKGKLEDEVVLKHS